MSGKRNRTPAKAELKGPKSYETPTLTKGPILSHFTADVVVSGEGNQ